MFTQFFGSYLVGSGMITPEQLGNALAAVKTTRVKLGALAINEGYMTAEQVDTVLAAQRTVDKRMGEIAVDMGFLTGEQVEKLFSAQTPIHLILGQALVNDGALTNSEFQEALESYKEFYSLTNDDFTYSSNEKIQTALSSIYEFDYMDDELMANYIELLFKNIVRFAGDDFMFVSCEQLTKYDFANACMQRLKGQFVCCLAVEGSDKAYAGFALRCSGCTGDENGSSADCIGGLLDIHNNMFAVNVLNDVGITLRPEPYMAVHDMKLADMEDSFKLSVMFPFGIINFVIGSY